MPNTAEILVDTFRRPCVTGFPLKLLVIKNNMLNQIAWEQMMFLGNPQFACELQPIDFALAAEAMGGIGYQRHPA